MPTLTPTRVISPDLEQIKQAKEAVRHFANIGSAAAGHSLRVKPDDRAEQTVEVPAAAFRLFLEILNQMAQGNTVTLVPTHHELTTQQAADLLHVSRPYLVKLLETKALEHHRVGARRRIKFEHLMAYAEKVKGESREALQGLAAEAQKLGMGY